MFHRRRESDMAQDAMSKAISSLDLGMPERVLRANAKADGFKTPEVRSVIVTLCHFMKGETDGCAESGMID